MDCLFCKITNKEIPSFKLYEDDLVLVFLDINPLNNGHCLIVPKKHIVTVDEIDEDLSKHLLKVIKEMKTLLEEKLACDGLTIINNNGYGQEVKHLHIHLIPRYENDNTNMISNKKDLVNIEDVYNQIIS